MTARPIPFDLLKDLRCHHCLQFLSCGPVYVLPLGSALCGRCQSFAKPQHRNYAFETVASQFLYPCRNWSKHCNRQLVWNECFEHEPECNYDGCCSLFCTDAGAFFSSERSFPNDDLYLTKIPINAVEQLHCNYCQSYLSSPPVYTNIDGETTCHRCVKDNGPPPDSVQNLAYETICNIIIFPCKFRNRGCPENVRFGRNAWQHEMVCAYGQPENYNTGDPVEQKANGRIFESNRQGSNVGDKIIKPLSKKERGVIQTHTGHYYGTITANSVPYAPPSRNQNPNSNKELIKSLKSKHERKYPKLNQEDDFTSNSSLNNDSRSSTPLSEDRLPNPNGYNQQQYYEQFYHPQDMQNLEPRLLPGYNELQHTPSFRNNQNTLMASESISSQHQRFSHFGENPPNAADGQYPFFPGNISRQDSFNSAAFVGRGNVMGGPNGNSRLSRISRSESIQNKELIGELRHKLKLKNSMNENKQDKRSMSPRSGKKVAREDSIYKNCKDLNDIKSVIDKIDQ